MKEITENKKIKMRDRLMGIFLLIASFIFLMGTIIYKDIKNDGIEQMRRDESEIFEEGMEKLDNEILSDAEIDNILHEARKKLEISPEEGNKLLERIKDYRGEASYYLGMNEYSLGKYDSSAKYMEKAVRLGNKEAMYILGEIYDYRKNYEEAEKWFLRAEQQGIYKASEKLYDIYRKVGKEDESRQKLKLLSERKSVPHMYKLGVEYIREKNYEEAVKMFEILKKFDYMKANMRLFDIEEIMKNKNNEKIVDEKLGNLTKKIKKSDVEMIFSEARKLFFSNREKSKSYFEKIEQYKPAAASYLAEYYMEESDFENAYKWLKNAAERGESVSMYDLAEFYMNEKNYAQAEKWYEEMIKNKYMTALCKLGELYEIKKNYEVAEKWYERALRNNKRSILNNLAVIYLKKGESEMAEKLLKEAAERNEFLAMINLAEKYSSEEKYEEASKIYMKLSEMGDVDSILKLGINEEARKRYENAEKYYLEAAMKGNIEAMFRLALFYDKIRGGKEKPKAIEWYEKAAEGGSGIAMYHLGEMYQKDFNDSGLARKWYMKALKNGRMDVKIKLKEIKDKS